MSVPRPTCHFHDAKIFQLISEIDQIEKNRCENIKGERVKYSNDLVQPKIVALSESEQSLLQHLLNRKQILHYPSIYPRFFNSPILGRCMYARDGGYIGFTHLQQNKWTDPFRFVMVRKWFILNIIDRNYLPVFVVRLLDRWSKTWEGSCRGWEGWTWWLCLGIRTFYLLQCNYCNKCFKSCICCDLWGLH